MSDIVHYLPGGPMPLLDAKRLKDIPCGIGRKKREFVASTKPSEVDCPRCLAAMQAPNGTTPAEGSSR